MASVKSAATVTRITGTMTSSRLYTVPSTSAPNSGVETMPRMPPNVAIMPSENGDQPFVAR